MTVAPMIPIEVQVAPGATSVYWSVRSIRMTYSRGEQAKEDFFPFWFDQMKQDSKRYENSHDQCHDQDLEEEHSLSTITGVEEEEDDQYVRGSDEDAGV